jgi:hypothetical protein
MFYLVQNNMCGVIDYIVLLFINFYPMASFPYFPFFRSTNVSGMKINVIKLWARIKQKHSALHLAIGTIISSYFNIEIGLRLGL